MKIKVSFFEIEIDEDEEADTDVAKLRKEASNFREIALFRQDAVDELTEKIKILEKELAEARRIA